MVKKHWLGMVLVVVALCGWGGAVHADNLSIHDVQFNTSDGDASVYDGQIHNVTGGIVTHVWRGFNDRVYLRDPAHSTWGAIVVKDGEDGELANNVNIGDWVSFSNIYVDESRGTTFLQYRRDDAPDVAFNIDSVDNTVPAPTLLTAADLAIPLDHSASEPYESMIVTLEDVTIGARDLGKAEDNYELWQDTDLAWGADYMNGDAGGPYHPLSDTGRTLDSITGLVEQYTKDPSWDYYQLLTRSTADIVPEPGTLLLMVGGVLLGLRRRR
ncbi:MAG: PEP-CTERM sorting domain-containing protein [bacterium]|nr:PEP-CTERM sorting domain-containing protein [bacterium]